jgi:cytochrome c
MTIRAMGIAAAFVITALSPAAVLLPGGGAWAQDDQGQVLFNNACRTCHTVNEGDNRLGPSLHGVVGRQAGALPDYPYSEALKGSGIVWDEANLDRFIENPDAVVPGNNMKPYTGIASPEERATIIAYLQAQSGEAQSGGATGGAAPAEGAAPAPAN